MVDLRHHPKRKLVPGKRGKGSKRAPLVLSLEEAQQRGLRHKEVARIGRATYVQYGKLTFIKHAS